MSITVPVTRAITRAVTSRITGGSHDTPGVNIPKVTIVLASEEAPICTFSPPTTNDCTISTGWSAELLNFVDPGSVTYQWAVSSNATMLDDGTSEGVIVQTIAAENQTVIITLNVTNGLESAFDYQFTWHGHNNMNEPPTFIGPDIENQMFPEDVLIVPIDFAPLFYAGFEQELSMTYTVVGSLPTGLSLSAAGVLSGTPLFIGITNSLEIRATNSKGMIDSNSFSINITL